MLMKGELLTSIAGPEISPSLIDKPRKPPTPALASIHSAPLRRRAPPTPKSKPLRFNPTAPVLLFTAQLEPE